MYLLDEQLESLIAQAIEKERLEGADQGVEAEAAIIVTAIRKQLAELRALAPTASIPSLLTFPELRRALRELIAPELPRVRVAAFTDIPPSFNIQPVARIAAAG